jgi:hypothetical protein
MNALMRMVRHMHHDPMNTPMLDAEAYPGHSATKLRTVLLKTKTHRDSMFT